MTNRITALSPGIVLVVTMVAANAKSEVLYSQQVV
jgi:hypothetical protein